jgi:hypothetical protein
MELLKEVLDAIEKGCLSVKWKGWSFSGGRDWGNWHTFEILKGVEKIGEIDLSFDYVNVELEDKCIFDIKEHIDLAEKVLMEALARDDKELCEKITDVNGNIKLPEDNDDIARAEIIGGTA